MLSFCYVIITLWFINGWFHSWINDARLNLSFWSVWNFEFVTIILIICGLCSIFCWCYLSAVVLSIFLIIGTSVRTWYLCWTSVDGRWLIIGGFLSIIRINYFRFWWGLWNIFNNFNTFFFRLKWYLRIQKFYESWEIGDNHTWVAILRCWWHFSSCDELATNKSNQSPTSQTCYQHKLSPTSVNDIYSSN